MPDDKILHFADHHDEINRVLDLPAEVRTYGEYLEHHYRYNQDADLPDLPDEFPEAKAVAQVNHGRWLWRCPACNAAMLLDKDDEHSICVRCGSHGWMVIAWPDNKAEIETELLKMTGDGIGERLLAIVREWRPGWTLEHLGERTQKALELSAKGVRVRALSIAIPRIWTVGEILTADKKNSYDSDIDRDLIGDHGIIELRTDLVNNVGGLRVPRLTTAQRTAQTTTNGTHVYDTTEDRVYRYEDGAWVASDDLTHQVLSGFTQGDILYVDTSGELARLGAGTSGQIFETRGTTADPVWADRVKEFTRYTSSIAATHTVEASAKLIIVEVVGGGGGGAAGGAGGGGAFVRQVYDAATIPSSLTVTVGAGGASSSSANGGHGGNSSVTGTDFALRAYGGAGGRDEEHGGGGGGWASAGDSTNSGDEPRGGGTPRRFRGTSGITYTNGQRDALSGGGGGFGRKTSSVRLDAGNAEYGGGGGAGWNQSGSQDNENGPDGGSSLFGAGGGGGGARGVTSGQGNSGGGDGGQWSSYVLGGGGAGGSGGLSGSNGANGTSRQFACGDGGGGGVEVNPGGGNPYVAGYTGGYGGTPGGGGGGRAIGDRNQDTEVKAPGGDGARGEVRIWEI